MLHFLARLLLEPLAAAGAIAGCGAGIADVIEVQAGHGILAGDLQHAVEFELAVFRMRRAEPIDRLAFEVHLRAAVAAEFFDEILGGVRQVEADFPDMDFQSVLFAAAQHCSI